MTNDLLFSTYYIHFMLTLIPMTDGLGCYSIFRLCARVNDTDTIIIILKL